MTDSEIKQRRACILGFPVDLMTKEAALNFAENRIKERQNLHVVTINPEIILAAEKNPELASVINRAELIIPESMGIELSLKRLGIYDIKKSAGIEFSEALIERCTKNNRKIAFLGATAEIVELMQKEFKLKYPEINIVYAHDGFFSEGDIHEISADLKKVEPDLLLVATGSPKQEFFINRQKKNLPGTVMIGVGGSFDIWAKKIKRAPGIFRMFGLEWLYRLIKQPSRFCRMFPSIPLFLIRTLIFKENSRKEY